VCAHKRLLLSGAHQIQSAHTPSHAQHMPNIISGGRGRIKYKAHAYTHMPNMLYSVYEIFITIQQYTWQHSLC
jgi:hypothetical protein